MTGASSRPPEVDAEFEPLANGDAPETAPPPDQPWLEFEIGGVRAVEHAAAPTLSFRLDIEDRSKREIFAAALTLQIMLEPVKRSYDDSTRERLGELFGEPGRWGTTARQLLWTTESVLVSDFKSRKSVDVPIQCNYDLELAATRYFSELPDGEVPLVIHFNGSVYYSDDDGRLQIIQIPWDTATEYRMPVSTWRQMIQFHYPFRTWVPLSPETLDRLRAEKIARGAHTYDDAIAGLIDRDPEADR